MKTALESLDALEALARRIAANPNGWVLSPSMIEEAQKIVCELPEPVDPLIQQARDIVADAYETGKNGAEAHRKSWASFCRNGSYDEEFPVQCTLIALRRARQEGVR